VDEILGYCIAACEFYFPYISVSSVRCTVTCSFVCAAATCVDHAMWAVQVDRRSTEEITLYRQPLPQAPAVHTVLEQPDLPGRAVEYVRINYFSSDATSEVMKVWCLLGFARLQYGSRWIFEAC
jgi:hypothetical protein